MDIVKCFNAIPRAPARELLCHLGAPRQAVQCWIEGLGRLGRASSFVGDVSSFNFSSTGLPEGDGVSVVAAVALGWLFCQVIQDYAMQPLVFVDNWSWTTDDHELNAAALEQTYQLTQSLRLRIDWRKSFGWSRHVEGQKWWRQHAGHLSPTAEPLAVLAEAKDLGAAMRYRNSRALGTLKSRILEAHHKLARLASQPRSIQNKAQLIQTAVWPAALYACEGHAVGVKHVHALRSAAARGQP